MVDAKEGKNGHSFDAAGLLTFVSPSGVGVVVFFFLFIFCMIRGFYRVRRTRGAGQAFVSTAGKKRNYYEYFK